MKKLIILTLFLCIIFTGCSNNSQSSENSNETETQQSSAENVSAAYLSAIMDGDFQTAADLMIPSFFNDAHQGTVSKDDWIVNSNKDRHDAKITIKDYIITRSGVVNPKVSIFIAGEPKKVYEAKFLIEHSGKTEWKDPFSFFVVEDQGKWWISLQGKILTDLYSSTIWIGVGNHFDRLTDHSEFKDR